jgi:hypothetical protein
MSIPRQHIIMNVRFFFKELHLFNIFCKNKKYLGSLLI